MDSDGAITRLQSHKPSLSSLPSELLIRIFQQVFPPYDIMIDTRDPIGKEYKTISLYPHSSLEARPPAPAPQALSLNPMTVSVLFHNHCSTTLRRSFTGLLRVADGSVIAPLANLPTWLVHQVTRVHSPELIYWFCTEIYQYARVLPNLQIIQWPQRDMAEREQVGENVRGVLNDDHVTCVNLSQAEGKLQVFPDMDDDVEDWNGELKEKCACLRMKALLKWKTMEVSGIGRHGTCMMYTCEWIKRLD